MKVSTLKSIQTKLATSYAQARAGRGILTGEFDPDRFPSVRAWIRACYHMPALFERRMIAVNEVLHGYGVEAIGDANRGPFALYVNLGNTYDTTIVRYRTGAYRITSLGDVVEARRKES